jgi:ABC-type molybdate transport system substrate-binding protein
MLASIPASMVNQKPADLGIPNRFKLSSSCFSKTPEAGKALIRFLAGPVAAPILKAKGFEPQ